MAIFKSKTFRNETVTLDGHVYFECAFIDCQYLYSGGKFALTNCTISGTIALTLNGPAASTLDLMQLIASSEGGRAMMIGMLDRKNSLESKRAH